MPESEKEIPAATLQPAEPEGPGDAEQMAMGTISDIERLLDAILDNPKAYVEFEDKLYKASEKLRSGWSILFNYKKALGK